MSDERHRDLRTDWLKLRGCLYDPVTGLPALPTVVDDVRRRLEKGERVGLIYIDPSSGGHLESTHGWQAYDELIRAVAEALGASRFVTTACLALVGVRSDEFVIFPSLDGEAPVELERLSAALVEEVEARLAEDGDLAFRVPLQSAAVALRIAPNTRIERSIYQGLGLAREICRQESERRRSGRLVELDRILEKRDVVVRYQPIVDLGSGGIHGFEALSRAPSSRIFENPDMLFSFAEENERILDLDRLCRQEAIARSRPLLEPGGIAAGSKLFLNCSAYVFHDASLLDDLLAGIAGIGLDPSIVVLEITERVAITEWQAFREVLDNLRGAGLQVAIDDMGSGYSSLRAVAEIEPDYLKFDLSLIADIHHSPIKRELLSTLVTLARRIEALPIAEGIETAEELAVVRELGVDYGQGYFFAYPSVPAEIEHVPRLSGCP